MASNGNFYYCKGCYKIDFCLVSVPTLNSGSSLSGTIIFFTPLSSNLLLTSSLLSHRIHKTLGENILKNFIGICCSFMSSSSLNHYYLHWKTRTTQISSWLIVLNDLPVLMETVHKSKTGHIVGTRSPETWGEKKRVVVPSFGKLQLKNLDSAEYFSTLGLSSNDLLQC